MKFFRSAFGAPDATASGTASWILASAPTKCAKWPGVRSGAIDAGRADLEHVRLGDRVLDVEDGRQLARHLFAIGEVDAILGDGAAIAVVIERKIDAHAKGPTTLLEQEAQIDEVVARRVTRGLDERDELGDQGWFRPYEIS